MDEEVRRHLAILYVFDTAVVTLASCGLVDQPDTLDKDSKYNAPRIQRLPHPFF